MIDYDDKPHDLLHTHIVVNSVPLIPTGNRNEVANWFAVKGLNLS